MALTENVVYTMLGVSTRIEGVLAGNTTYYRGGILVVNTSGQFAKGSNAVDLVPAGIYTGFGIEEPFSSLAIPNGQTRVGEVIKGKVYIPFSGAVQADVGQLFYITDDNTLTKTQGLRNWALLCEQVKDGKVLVDFNHPIPVAVE